ncbi:MAG: Na+/H+ antiporter subunit E [Candidatus Omnitrophota bacterium]
MRLLYSRTVTFFVSFVLWLFLSFSLDWQHVLIGIIIAGVVALLMGDMFAEEGKRWFELHRYGWFVVYMIVFAFECIKANIDVAYRVIHPYLPINPGIVKVKTTLKSETALTFLANSITLTPGTFSVDIDRDKGLLYIHWIKVSTQDIEEASRIIVARFERILKRIFE